MVAGVWAANSSSARAENVCPSTNPANSTASLASSHDQVELDEYDLRRMLLGVPEGSNEIVPGSALPLESCMDIHGGSKSCTC
jgi:hypothetical protein